MIRRAWGMLGALLLLIGTSTPTHYGAPSTYGADAEVVQYFSAADASSYGMNLADFTAAVASQRAQEYIVAEIRKHPDQYGGIYWDWEADPPGFVILRTHDQSPAASGIPVRYVAATRAFTQLEAIRDEMALVARAEDPAASGFVSIGIDEQSNSVSLVVIDAESPLVDLSRKYGPAVVVSVGVPATPSYCYSRTDCTPFRGAIDISSSGGSCSYGLNAIHNGNRVVVTAGHCDWDTYRSWYHSNTSGVSSYVGYSAANGLHNGMDVDALRITASSAPGVTAPFNRVYHNDSSKSLQIKGTIAEDEIYAGMVVRRSGFQTADFGEVTGGVMLYTMFVGGGWRFAWGWPTNTTSIGGDSGGPVYHFSEANVYELVGIHSVAEGIFASQEDAKRVLNLDRWCLNTDCN